jgi:hypothetical protein
MNWRKGMVYLWDGLLTFLKQPSAGESDFCTGSSSLMIIHWRRSVEPRINMDLLPKRAGIPA